MQAKEIKLLEFLSKAQTQFTIPIYQRTYSWEKSHCEQLWKDIVNTGRSDDTSEHFIGSVAYISGIHQVANQPALRVIDGQQRLTTTMLILEALARRLEKDKLKVEGFSAVQIRNTYLLNPYVEGEHHYKLRLTQTDEESLKAVVQHKEAPDNMSVHIDANFRFFTEKMQKLNDGDLKSLCKGLYKLTVIDMVLVQGNDKPQRIFESMNSTGRRLSESDLIRNFVLMDLDEEHQNRLYKEHWRKMEVGFGQKEYENRSDDFMRYYLTMKTGKIPKTNTIYEEFKEYAGKPEIKTDVIDKLMADIHKFARYYCAIALDNKEPDEKLSRAFGDLRGLKVDAPYPFLLEVYDDYKNELLTRDDFEEAVRLIESYVFRRAICRHPSNTHTKIFAALGKKIDKGEDLESANRSTASDSIFRKKPDRGRYLESIKERLLALRDNQELPKDVEFKEKFSTHRYPNDKYWLSRIENHGCKETVDKGYSIEHIMPQTLTDRWRSELGYDYDNIHKEYLNSPGNLTLTGYNSEYSNRPFAEKRDMEVGFATSHLKLNKGLGALDRWNKKTIEERAKRLATMATDVWPFPVLPKTPRALSNTGLRPTGSNS